MVFEKNKHSAPVMERCRILVCVYLIQNSIIVVQFHQNWTPIKHIRDEFECCLYPVPMCVPIIYIKHSSIHSKVLISFICPSNHAVYYFTFTPDLPPLLAYLQHAQLANQLLRVYGMLLLKMFCQN